MATSWNVLPMETLQHIVTFLPPNDVSCTMRLVDRSTNTKLSLPCHKIVRLSEPVPHVSVRWLLTDKQIINTLSRKNRINLVSLIARSGELANLEMAIECSSILPSTSSTRPMNEAVAAGHHHICERLHQLGWSYSISSLNSAASAGRADMCEWLIERGCEVWTPVCASAAARGGHAELARWFIRRLFPSGLDDWSDGQVMHVLEGFAMGCDMKDMRHAQEVLLFNKADGIGHRDLQAGARVFAAALCSPSADWKDKVTYLAPKILTGAADDGVCKSVIMLEAVKNGIKLDRLKWFLDADIGGKAAVVVAVAAADTVKYMRHAAKMGDVAIVKYLLDTLPCDLSAQLTCASAAAGHGHLGIIEHLRSHGIMEWPGSRVNQRTLMSEAAQGGHMCVVKWLVDVAHMTVHREDPIILQKAIASGNNELVIWLYENGARLDLSSNVWTAAVNGGSKAVLQFLLSKMQVTVETSLSCALYVRAGLNSDMYMAHALRECGFVWSRSFFLQLVTQGEDYTGEVIDITFLERLLQEGFPVDWETIQTDWNNIQKRIRSTHRAKLTIWLHNAKLQFASDRI